MRQDCAYSSPSRHAPPRSEFVVNIISDWYVEAANHTSGDFARGVDEMAAAGLTPQPSALVKPPRVAEAAVQLECRLRAVHEVTDRCGARRAGRLCACAAVWRLLARATRGPRSHAHTHPRTPCPVLRSNGAPSAAVVIGEVVMAHVAEAVTARTPTGKVRARAARCAPAGRLP